MRKIAFLVFTVHQNIQQVPSPSLKSILNNNKNLPKEAFNPNPHGEGPKIAHTFSGAYYS